MDKLKIPEGTIITCPTYEESQELIKLFDKLGLTWNTGESYLALSTWKVYKVDTYYNPHKGSYGSIKTSGASITNRITAKEFIKLHTVKERNVTLTLDKAKEFYNSSNEALKEIALQAFAKEELTEEPWKKIKTFWDAVNALNLPTAKVQNDLNLLVKMVNGYHLIALYKIDIIRKALNKDFDSIKDDAYYPSLKVRKSDDKHKDFVVTINGDNYGITVYTFKAPNRLNYCNNVNVGWALTDVSLCCCGSEAIARHFGKYFAKEILDIVYK